MHARILLALLSVLCIVPSDAAAQDNLDHPPPKPPFEIRDGARVLFLGDAFFERDYTYGFIETALTNRLNDRKVIFRNLGWTGDTVWGDSRAGFDTPREGFERRRQLVLALEPDVLLICYGMNESFAGQDGLNRFIEGYRALLDSIEPSKARIVLVSPITHENLGPPLPDPGAHNRDLIAYRDAIKALASERGHAFVDLIAHRIGDGMRSERALPVRETDDGIHLNAFGYSQAAEVIAAVLAPSRMPSWRVALRADGREGPGSAPISGTKLSDIQADDRGLRFRALDESLPLDIPAGTPAPHDDAFRRLVVIGLRPGHYTLKIDGAGITTTDAETWGKGVTLDRGPEFDQVRALRQAIIEKNALLFHRLRPQNETYLYLFRKHEQGHLADEVPKFDPLVREKEAEIERLKKPAPHTYELIRVEEPR